MEKEEKKEKKFNVVLFIVLLICLFPAGIIYGIAGAVKAYKAKKGAAKNDGFISKLLGGIVGFAFSVIMALCFWGESDVITFICVGVVGLILILFAILNKKTNKKIFNILYLIALIVYFILPLPIMMIQIMVGILLAVPTTIGAIFGVVGVIRSFKA